MTPPAHPPPIVVIGGSAGSITPLRRIVAGLGADLPAAVCVVVHLPAEPPSALPGILARSRDGAAAFGRDGEALAPGMLRIAPPGFHLLVHDGHLRLSAGAAENGVRPALDALFRSAARAAGSRVISVLLSGTLDDGSGGSAAVRRAGGWTIAQDPADAEFSDMPANAIAAGAIRDVLPGDAIAMRVRELVLGLADAPPAVGGALAEAGDARDAPPGDPSADVVERGLVGPAVDLDPPASPYVCPACGGVLYERDDDQYVCRVGHRYSSLALGEGQRAAIEDAVWTALRTLEEAASLAGRVRDRARARGDHAMERRFEGRRVAAQERADRIRLVLDGVPRRSGDGADEDEAADPAASRAG